MPAERLLRTSDGTVLAVEEAERQDGELAGAPPLVLLHGLTATRRYVTMGSRLLQRAGARVISYDARGHGASDAAAAPDAGAYGYPRLARDLLDVLDALQIQRAVLAGVSMGAHTAARFAIDHRQRVAALAFITPAYDPHAPRRPDAFAEWDALARGLRHGGIERFLAAYDLSQLPEAWRGTVENVIRQRLAAHRHPLAVADALEAVPRSIPFQSIDQLARVRVPSVVIGDRDRVDPGHPLAVAELYAQALHAELLVEPPGSSPLAWQGAQVSRALARLLRDASPPGNWYPSSDGPAAHGDPCARVPHREAADHA
ncbi:MAG: alpha/beta fold hydrolase [Solirubrobacteraceae bacterium]